MTRIIVAGTDPEGVADELDARNVSIARVDFANRPALEEAGIHDADAFVLTEAEQATSIVVARDLEPDLRIVAYTNESLPEFVSGQQVLSMDPDLLGVDAFVDELLE